MWFFIVALVAVGAFFLGAIFWAVASKDTMTDREFIKGELKIIMDALNEPFCQPPFPLTSYKYTPGIPMPDPGFKSQTVTCNNDKNE